MLNRGQAGSWALSLIFVFFCLWIIQASETFQECVHTYPDAKPEQVAIERLSYTFGLLKRCSGLFLSENGEAITALFTVVLAVSTILLWRSTKALWDAGEKQIGIARDTATAARDQADALIGVEIARLRVFKIDLSSTTGLQTLTPKVERAAFEVEFMNYGRTPAFLTGGCGRTHIGKTLPTEPQHAPAFHFASSEVIEAGRKWTFPINAFGGRMTNENAADVLNDRTNLWIYGYIEFRDFQHRQHREPFLWQFLPHKGLDAGYAVVERDGPEAYTRRW